MSFSQSNSIWCVAIISVSLTFFSIVSAQRFPVGNGSPNRIIGGEPAGKFLTKHMANIAISFKDADYNMLCTATVIHKRWLMTAAHCFLGPHFKFTASAENTYAFVGESSSILRAGNTLKKPYWVKFYLIHKLYKPGTPDHRSDIALVYLDREIPPTKYSKVRLTRDLDETPKNGMIVSAAGYGALDASGTQSDRLMKTSVILKPFVTCSQREGQLFKPYIADKTQVCAVSLGWPEHGATDTCYGDSGGPLFVFDPKTQSILQFGITSFGSKGCAVPGSIAWYTRVSHYYGLIQQGMRKNYQSWNRYT